MGARSGITSRTVALEAHARMRRMEGASKQAPTPSLQKARPGVPVPDGPVAVTTVPIGGAPPIRTVRGNQR